MPDDDDPAPPPVPPDDDDPPPPPMSPMSPAPGAAAAASTGPQSPTLISVDRSGPTTTASDFEVLIRELKRLVGAPADDASKAPQPVLSCTWEAISNDPYLNSYFQERVSATLNAARQQKIVDFKPERLVRGVKKDAEVRLLTYAVPDNLKGAAAYMRNVAKAEARAADNERKAAEMREKIKNMRTTVGTLLVEEEIVEEEEEVSGDDESDAPPPPPPPEESDDDGAPPPPPPEDSDEEPPPPPPPDE